MLVMPISRQHERLMTNDYYCLRIVTIDVSDTNADVSVWHFPIIEFTALYRWRRQYFRFKGRVEEVRILSIKGRVRRLSQFGR